MHLTRHFIENWRDRVGSHPTEGMVSGIIRDSIRLHKGRTLFKADGQPFNTLSIYWHPDLKLVLYVDRFNDAAVSVISRDNMPVPDKKPGQADYTPLTMHWL